MYIHTCIYIYIYNVIYIYTYVYNCVCVTIVYYRTIRYNDHYRYHCQYQYYEYCSSLSPSSLPATAAFPLGTVADVGSGVWERGAYILHHLTNQINKKYIVCFQLSG